ncbi:MAG: ABC transporter ATP-binding protein [Chloroflexi bacterium]|nr:MAG: ABC transporter ATP-binding protein [Chloroflexota bacterium]TMC71228.1 MAG: ABC transporter ATP-binding protein [Chloroflexota bacterium]
MPILETVVPDRHSAVDPDRRWARDGVPGRSFYGERGALSLLELRDVKVVYQRRDGTLVPAVAGASLDVDAGEIVGLVGETGCGKSSLAKAAVGLVPVAAGTVTFDGRPVHVLGRRARRASERRLQLVFQNPYESINPRRTVGAQVADAFAISHTLPRESWRARVDELLRRVGLPLNLARRFPHQLSGGQRQRIAIARALAADPAMIVLDEPLSALDSSVQAQVANLLVDLARDLHVGMLLISHDLAIVRHVAHRTAVMYLGVIVETAPTAGLWRKPMHPYTQALIDAVPHADGAGHLPVALSGEIPDPARPPSGCRFHPRCPHVMERCLSDVPELVKHGGDRQVACWLHEEPVAARPADDLRRVSR